MGKYSDFNESLADDVARRLARDRNRGMRISLHLTCLKVFRLRGVKDVTGREKAISEILLVRKDRKQRAQLRREVANKKASSNPEFTQAELFS